MALIDEFDGSDIDLSQIPGFESLADQDEGIENEGENPDIGGENEAQDGLESGGANLGAQGERVPAGAVSRKEFETLQSQNAELIAMLREAQNRPPAPVYVQPPPAPVNMQAQREALEQQYYADPLGTSQRIAQAAAQNAYGNDLAALRETLAQQTVQNFRQNVIARDPQFAAAAKYFDEQVAKVPPGNLSRLNPTQMQEFLDFAETAAWGRVMKEVRQNQAKQNKTRSGASAGNNAPAYGGTGRGGSGASQRQSRNNPGDMQARLNKALGLTQADYDGINEG